MHEGTMAAQGYGGAKAQVPYGPPLTQRPQVESALEAASVAHKNAEDHRVRLERIEMKLCGLRNEASKLNPIGDQVPRGGEERGVLAMAENIAHATMVAQEQAAQSLFRIESALGL